MQQAKLSVVSAHVVGWLLFLSLMVAFVAGQAHGGAGSSLAAPLLLFAVVYASIFYLNTYVLLPRLYFQKRYGLYFLVIAGLLALTWWLQPFEQLQGHGGPPDRPAMMGPPTDGPPPGAHAPSFDIISLIVFFMTWSLSTALQFIKRWRLTEQRALQAENDRAQAELSFLKAQINPHFLFNTLNNLYSMALARNEDTPSAILKLSNIMRYVTDEVNQQFVPLQSEIDCATDYIALQRLRLSSRVPIRFTVSGRAEGKEIAPLVLISFIENVFKYGVSAHDPAEIIIAIEAGEEEVKFFCSNKIFPLKKAERTGIGIANTKARLERLYGSRHRLEIGQNGLFTVLLVVPARPVGQAFLS